MKNWCKPSKTPKTSSNTTFEFSQMRKILYYEKKMNPKVFASQYRFFFFHFHLLFFFPSKLLTSLPLQTRKQILNQSLRVCYFWGLDSRVGKQLRNTLDEWNHRVSYLWEDIGKCVEIRFIFREHVETKVL